MEHSFSLVFDYLIFYKIQDDFKYRVSMGPLSTFRELLEIFGLILVRRLDELSCMNYLFKEREEESLLIF